MPHRRIADLIYEDTRTGALYERPCVNGRWTYRKLLARTVKVAKEEVYARRQAQARAAAGLDRDPYGPPPPTVRALAHRWLAAGCPTLDMNPREGTQLAQAESFLEHLLPYWGHRQAETLTIPDCQAYARLRATPGKPRTRAVDLELATLSCILKWAHRTGLLIRLPALDHRPRFHRTRAHCRDYMPRDAAELHTLAMALFENPRSVALGWQLLLEAFTGCRTSEILALRRASLVPSVLSVPHYPGHVEGDHLWLDRRKGGINPFAVIQPALRQLIDAQQLWHNTLPRTSPAHRSPWWIPSFRVPGQPSGPCALTHALSRLAPMTLGEGRKVTSHALRAYYVTVRRSQGISDAQIAAEIGDATGAAIIATTYGAVPPNWAGSTKPLTWLPESDAPAWSILNLPTNAVALPAQPLAATA